MSRRLPLNMCRQMIVGASFPLTLAKYVATSRTPSFVSMVTSTGAGTFVSPAAWPNAEARLPYQPDKPTQK